MKCGLCGGKAKATKVKHAIKVGAHSMKGTLPAEKCTACDEVTIAGPDLEKFERAAARAILGAGLVNGDTFRFLRKVLGLQAKQLAPMLGTTKETISRWENGERNVDRASWLALGMLVADAGHSDGTRLRAADVVASVQRPKRLPATVHG